MALPSGGHGFRDSTNTPYAIIPHDGLEVDRSRAGFPVTPYPSDLEVTPLQGLETTPAECYLPLAPQTLPGSEKEAYESKAFGPGPDKIPVLESSSAPKIRQKWKLWLLTLAAALTIVAIAIAVPLGLRHSRDNSRIPVEPIKPAPNASAPHTFSTSGAFNGTSLATFNVAPNEELVTHIFYQDYQGQLRRVEKDGSTWSGGPAIAAIVSSNAKNATPLTCVNYTDATTNTPTAHLIYADPSNLLQEVVSTDSLKTWQKGTLGNSTVKISPSAFALTALYTQASGLRLYYGGADSLVHELVYLSGDKLWSEQFRFDGSNGNGGIAHSSLDEDTGKIFAQPDEKTGIARLFVLDGQNTIRAWNLTISPTTTSNWTLDPIPAPVASVAVNSSLASAQGRIFYQEPSGAISAVGRPTPLNLTWGSSTNIGSNMTEIALPRSAIAAASVFVGGPLPVSIDIWYQSNGSNIMESLDINATFTLTQLPV